MYWKVLYYPGNTIDLSETGHNGKPYHIRLYRVHLVTYRSRTNVLIDIDCMNRCQCNYPTLGDTKCPLYGRFDFDFIVFNATFNNISAILWRLVLVVEEAGVPGENHRPWASNW